MLDQNKIDEMIKTANAGDVDEATVERIMNNLSESDKRKVNDILGNKEKLNQILADKNVRALLNKFKNGRQ